MKRKNSKGQVISLDALMALTIVMLAIGICFNVMETNSYDLKEQQLFQELKSVGNTAGNLLVSNPIITCKVVDGAKELFSMNNCINQTTHIRKSYLGLTSEDSCYIKGLLNTECTDHPADANNIYSETRKVILDTDGKISKADFEGKHFTITDITIMVWRK